MRLHDDKVIDLVMAAIVAANISGLGQSRVLLGMDRDPDDLPREITVPEHWVCVTGLDLEQVDETGDGDDDAYALAVRMVLFTTGPESSDQRAHYQVRSLLAAALKDKGLVDPGTGTTVNLDRASRRSLDVPSEDRLVVLSLVTATGTVIGSA